MCRFIACVLSFCPLVLFAQEQPQFRPGGPLAGLRGFEFGSQKVPLYPGAVEVYSCAKGGAHPLFDRQSLRKLWQAPNLPMRVARPFEQFQPKAERSFRGQGPFSVVRCGIRSPVFTVDCGELPPSLYAIRVIGAVETANLRTYRQPLYLGMKVNDQLDGGSSDYRIRIGYTDDFFSVAEIYFHAPAKRRYAVELWVDRGSQVELLVHSLTLDDVMAGVRAGPWKQRRSLVTDEELAQLKGSYSREEQAAEAAIPKLTPEERLARDVRLWNWLPPLNAQGSDFEFFAEDYAPGTADKPLAEIETDFGKWESPGGVGHQVDNNLGFCVGYGPDAFLVNRKLGMTYTMADLAAHRPLPDPFPYKDDGAGLFYPDPGDLKKGRTFCPIADAVHYRLRQSGTGWRVAAELAVRSGNENLARDAAVLLVRHAWQFPSIDSANFFYAVVRQPAWQNYDFRCSNRVVKAEWLFQYDQYLAPLRAYDLLFDYIHNNRPLADSLHRFIPSIRTPDDVTAFLDAFLVQHLAKRTLRGFDHTWPSAIATIAAAVGQPQLADEWVKPYADGLLSFLFNDTDSHGCKKLGSTFYSHGEGAREHGVSLDQYIRAGGNPELSLLAKTPRPLKQCEWALDIMTAGWDWLRIGDVTGPSGNFTHARGWSLEAAEPGWRWSRDPRFAWVLKHVRGRKQEGEAEWLAIERAAADQPRAPWLDNRSRVVANWAALLETGLEHDDPRFRRSAWLRVGSGSGHAHSDLLDLHLYHAGLQAMIEGGQRSGYSKPNDKLLRVHNTVEVLDGESAALEEPNPPECLTGLVDASGSRTLEALAAPTKNASLYRRRIALIDVDEGSGSRRLTPRQQTLADDLSKGVTPANSYLVDIFRVAGGAMHSYAIHGTVNDDFQWNALDVKPVEHVKPTTSFTSEADYLSIFEQTPESKAAGDAPDNLEATWRMVRFEKDTRGGVSEETLFGKNFDPGSPRRFTKLHLLGARGLRVLKADVLQTKCAEAENVKKNWGPPLAGYRWTCLYARNAARQQPLESAFVGIIEPYLGEPYIASAKLFGLVSRIHG
jgi:hypothetical protein